LLSSEEMLKSTDQADYFKVPLDARGLEYELFYEEGETEATRVDDYTSANTEQLDVAQTKELLVQLPEVKALLERTAP
jgi:UDP-glucose 4-epimerase